MYSRLTPILPVPDVLEERRFYENLGFERDVDPAESYPEDQFAALVHGSHILFGLAVSSEGRPLTEHGLYWQFETTDLEALYAMAKACGAEVLELPTRQPWGRRTMALRSPAGYRVTFEETAS
jgi:catechol 2,3-dioxygenase-like lactoylglutathione lyase family enzyme